MKVPAPRKLKSGTWFIQLRLGGESISVSARTKKECIDKARLIKAEYMAGKREPKKEKPDTLVSVVDAYIRDSSGVLSPSTIRGYEQIKRNRFQSVMKKPVNRIENWQSVINSESKTCSAKTLKNGWSLIAASMAAAGYAVPDVKLPQIVKASRPWLDAEQIRLFIEAVRGKECEIPALLSLHSLRRSEIMALTWEKIDLEGGIIRVEGSAVLDKENKLVYKETNKSKKSRRTVPIMIPALKRALENVPPEERAGLLLRCNPNTIWAQINRVCRVANIPQVGVHGLRHSFASLAHHVGMPEQEAMIIGGWEDMQTMRKIYTHISELDMARAKNKMAEFYKNANQNANEE